MLTHNYENHQDYNIQAEYDIQFEFYYQNGSYSMSMMLILW